MPLVAKAWQNYFRIADNRGRYADCMKARHSKFRIVLLFALLITCGLFSFAAFTIAWNFDYFGWHSKTKWVFHSNEYKARVLSEPPEPKGLLRHVEWDGWGFAGNDTTVYLVFDPADALSAAAHSATPGKYPGLPCGVARVKRLDQHWYTVLFYTETDWDHCA
jgi:hypothetical protein